MIKIMGHDVWRSGEKIGYFDATHVWAHDGKKLGYFEGNHVYGMDGHKVAYMEGNYLYSVGSSSAKVTLDKVNEAIEGGVLPEIGKCAVYVLLGA